MRRVCKKESKLWQVALERVEKESNDNEEEEEEAAAKVV